MEKLNFVYLAKLAALCSTSFLLTNCQHREEPAQPPLTFTLQVAETADEHVKVQVTPSSETSLWYASAVEQEVYDVYPDPSGFVGSITSELRGELNNGKSPDELLYSGTMEITVDGLSPETSYVFYAVGLDREMNPVSELETVEFTTVADSVLFTVKVENVTLNSADFQVIPDDPEMGYTFQIAQKVLMDSFESESAFIEDILAFVLEAYGSYADAIVTGESFWQLETLVPGTEYCALVFGLEADGYVTTALHKKEFSTEAVQMADVTFDVDLSVTHNVADFTIIPSDQQAAYWYTFISAEEMADMEPSECFSRKFEEYYSQYMMSPSVTVEEVFEAVARYGTQSSEETCMAEQKWYLLAGGINSQLYLNTEVSVTEFTTGEAHLDYTIDIEVSDVHARSATVTLQFSGPMNYYYKVHTKEFADSFSSDEELRDALDFENNVFAFSGLSMTINEENLMPGTEYCLIVVGYNEGPATAPVKEYFTTVDADSDPSQTTFDITVSPRFSSAEVSVVPSSSTVQYVYGLVEDDVYREALKDENPIEALLEVVYADDLEWDTLPATLLWYAKEGNASNFYTELASETDYVVYAVAIYEDGTLAGDGTFKEFRTPAREFTDAAVEIVNVRWFQMAELREEFPDASWYEGNQAVVVWELEPNSSAAHVYCDESYEDPSLYSDEDLFAELYPWWETERMMMSAVVRWDESTYIMAMGVDENGNYGEISYVEVIPVMEECSPASEFPTELLNTI